MFKIKNITSSSLFLAKNYGVDKDLGETLRKKVEIEIIYKDVDFKVIAEKEITTKRNNRSSFFDLRLMSIEETKGNTNIELFPLKEMLHDFFGTINYKYNKFLEISFNEQLENKNRILNYLNEKTKTLDIKKIDYVEEIKKDNSLLPFLDYLIELELKTTTETFQQTIESLILEKIEIFEKIMNTDNVDLIIEIEKSYINEGKKTPETYLKNLNKGGDYLYIQMLNILDSNNTKLSSPRRIYALDVMEDDIVEGQSEWFLFENRLFFNNFYFEKELSETVKVKRIIKKLEELLQSKKIQTSCEVIKIDKELFELNYIEKLNIDYDENHYLIRAPFCSALLVSKTNNITKDFTEEILDLIDLKKEN